MDDPRLKAQYAELLQVVTALATQNFDKKAAVLGVNEELDGLAVGLNMLGEELKAAIQQRNELFEKERSWAEAEARRTQAELVVARAHLAEAANLASLGTLAAGIAHELNNPLTVIWNCAEQTEAFLNEPESVLKRSKMIIRAVLRMKTVIQHLLIFAREGRSAQIADFSLYQSIQDSLILIEDQLKRAGIKVTVSLDSSDSEMKGNASQMESVFQNLFSNSYDAFALNRSIKNPFIRIRAGASATRPGWIEIEYEDNAGGIPQGVVSRIFEPFFTTKEVGKGTGLGMALVHGIVESHGGSIRVTSREGKGTSFELSFPMAAILAAKAA